MKLKPAQIEPFLQRPDAGVATVLLFGPDAGLVAERARRLAEAVVEDLSDPFRVSELSTDELRAAPGRLVEEAQALCLLGGRRLVRVRDADDGMAPAVRQLLALSDQAGFVVLEAGELAAGSSLRRLIEAAKSAVALPCYRDEGAGLATAVNAMLAERGLVLAPDALAYLLEHLGGDRAVTRAEIDKLALYVADRPGGRVALEDVAAIVGDSAALSLDDVVHAAVLGDVAKLDRCLERLLAEGQAPVRILRAAAGFLMRLLRLHAEVAGGTAIEAAIRAAKPPVHFRLVPVLSNALRRWSGDGIVRGLALLQDAEIRCKSSAMPEALVCRAALLRLGAVAGERRAR